MTPAQFIREAKYDEFGQIIWGVQKNGHLQMIADVRGWGAIQNLFPNDQDAAERFQDELGKFIVEAINDKIKSEKP